MEVTEFYDSKYEMNTEIKTDFKTSIIFVTQKSSDKFSYFNTQKEIKITTPGVVNKHKFIC